MIKILAFAGSNSRQSINKQFVTWAVSQVTGAESLILDLNDFEMPIFSVDREKEQGIPEAAQRFSGHIADSDMVMLSLAENNGAYSAAFKNIFDWVSRIPGQTVFRDKPVFIMATSPGARGGASVLAMAVQRFPFNGARVTGSFSLPSFQQNFAAGQGIIHDELKTQFSETLKKALEASRA